MPASPTHVSADMKVSVLLHREILCQACILQAVWGLSSVKPPSDMDLFENGQSFSFGMLQLDGK